MSTPSYGDFVDYRVAKWGCLKLSQHAIEKYCCHIRSVIMGDATDSIVANHHDFTVSLNIVVLLLGTFKIVLVALYAS